MLQVNIKEEDKAVFAHERYEHVHPRVCQRMDALHLKSKGLSNHQICAILGICNNTLLGYYKMYQAYGIEGLRELNFHRPQSQLVLYKDSLEEYFTKNPPSSIGEATKFGNVFFRFLFFIASCKILMRLPCFFLKKSLQNKKKQYLCALKFRKGSLIYWKTK